MVENKKNVIFEPGSYINIQFIIYIITAHRLAVGDGLKTVSSFGIKCGFRHMDSGTTTHFF